MDFWDLKHELDKGGFLIYYMFLAVIISLAAAVFLVSEERVFKLISYFHYAMP
ncbi:hypothetical protein [uncultured Campylobacter sp.]|uniref:hypothetical protein n=1 Tax=uncultured Campylobacter sp. TaxID=218934 RepID=UPI0026270F56|nr:hypothetical protein [uncultured Campylobacter sp.]